MATPRSYFNTFISLILLLFHLGCFIFTSTNHHSSSSNKKRKVNPSSPFNTPTTTTTTIPSPPPPSHLKSKPRKTISSSWTFFKQIISSFKNPTKNTTTTLPSPTLSSSARSSNAIINPCSDTNIISPPPRKRRTGSCSDPADISLDHRSFPLRNDIFPCPTCGEIFQKPQHVEQHQSIKHAITELYEGDSGKNVVRIIFKTGWNNRLKNPTIHRVLKIHNSPKILRRFEDYRELVKSKELARSGGGGGVRRRDERCVADGNELLRFHCSTFICNLGQNGNSSICTQQYCSVCGIIRSGFSAKMDGISTVSNSWRAHVSIPDELEEEFAFMNVKRAMLICRVVAGRIGSDQGKGDTGFDSVIGTSSGGNGGTRTGGGSGGGAYGRLDEDELLVFNPRAVLPCFAIMYSM